MYSSQSNQVSYQDENLSYFTNAILDSVLNHDLAEIRYKDVIDYVSDLFMNSEQQRPFFVTQADFTEVFCTVSETLKQSIRSSDSGLSLVENKDTKQSITLADRVRTDAKQYSNEEQVYKALLTLKEAIQTPNEPDDFGDLYSIDVQEGKEFSNLPDTKTIGDWLSETKAPYFAVPFLKAVQVKKRKPKNPLKASLLFSIDESDFIITEEEEMRTVGFKPTVDMPYLYLTIKAKPKYPNIPYIDCYIVPIVSRTDIRIFTALCRYRDIGWDKRVRDNDIKWATKSYPAVAPDLTVLASQDISDQLWSFIREHVEQKFGISESAFEDNDNSLSTDDTSSETSESS